MNDIRSNSEEKELTSGSEEAKTKDTISEASTTLDGLDSSSSSKSRRSDSVATTVVPGYDRSRQNSFDSNNGTDISTDDEIELLTRTIKEAEEKLTDINTEIQSITTHFDETHTVLEEQRMISEATLAAMQRKEQLTPFFKITELLNARKEVEDAKQAVEKALSNLTLAEASLKDELDPLLEARKMFEPQLLNARSQLDEFKEGKRTSIDDSKLYQPIAESDEHLSIREEVRSNYEKEVPYIEEELDLLIANKITLKEQIERKQGVIQTLNELIDIKKDMLADKKSWKEDFDKTKEKSTEVDLLVKKLEPTGFFGRMIEAFFHLFGKTVLDTAKEDQKYYNKKLNNLETEMKIALDDLEDKYSKVQISITEQHQALEELDKTIGTDTPEKIDEQIKQLEMKLERHVDTFKPSLKKRCEPDDSLGVLRDKESTASKNVKEALKKFLDDSSKTNLANLIKAMSSNPKYSTDLKLTQLLNEARQLYSDIPSPQKSLLPVNQVYLIQSLSNQKEINLEKISKLEAEIEPNIMKLQSDSQLIQTEKQPIYKNVEALKKCLTILFVAKTFSSDDKDETTANNALIAQVEMKIANLKNSIPTSDIRALDYYEKVLKQHAGVEPDFKDIQNEMSALLERYSTTDNPVPKDINARTFYEFKFKLNDENQAEVWQKMQDIEGVTAQLLDGDNYKTRILEASDVTPARIHIMEMLKDKAYLIYDAINELDTAMQDPKAPKQFQAALETLAANIDNADKTINLLAVIEFQTTINAFDDSIKERYQGLIDKLNDTMDPFSNSIQWVCNPKLKSTIDQLEQKDQQLATEIHTGQREIESLQQSNTLLDSQLSLAQQGDTKALIEQSIASLIKECEKPIRSSLGFQRNEKVRLSLKEFLSEPTNEHLDSLTSVMKSDLSYLKNDKLISLVNAAGDLYPSLATTHNELKQTAAPTPAAADYKQQLQDLKTNEPIEPIVNDSDELLKKSAFGG